MFETMRVFFATALLVIVFLQSASASAPCHLNRNEIANLLKDEYSEHPVSMGLLNNGNLFEIFASETGTFTIVMTFNDNKISCVMGGGVSWHRSSLPKKNSGKKT
jgi:hypothetical protein